MLFLNNAINHGVFTPLGIAEAAEQGKSVLFLLEANPGPGLGLLLAFTFFGKGVAKASAPGAALIQFVGGIHEIYFPYVLMKPKLIVAMILGGMTGVATNMVFDFGLVAPAAPGSIIAVWRSRRRADYRRRHARRLRRRCRLLPGRLVPAQAGQGRRRGRPGGGHRRTWRPMKGKKSSVAGALTGGARDQGDPLHRVRLRRGHGLLGDGRLGAAQEDPGRRAR